MTLYTQLYYIVLNINNHISELMASIHEIQQAANNRFPSKYEGSILCETVSMNTHINT